MDIINQPDNVVSRAIGLFQSDQQIDVIKLSKSYGIDVYAKSEPDFNASIQYEAAPLERFYIEVNPEHNKTRMRFSVAHELAHFILHKEEIMANKIVDRDSIHSLTKEEEVAANRLAAEILMPDELINGYISNNSLDGDKVLAEGAIRKVADYFSVSLMVAILRLKGLGYEVPYISFS